MDGSAHLLSIAAVERDTGLSKDTLRVWERRYGFPSPHRDAHGQRFYTGEDVSKLRLAKRLLDYGYRPGKILTLSAERLLQMVDAAAAPKAVRHEATHPDADVEAFLQLIQSHRVDELRRKLSGALLHLGLAHFVADLVAPLNERVGEAWARGKLEIFEEHLYAEMIQGILRNAITSIPRPGAGTPVHVMLTTFPGEPHGIGLLMAEAFFALEGCRCVSLGVQTPVPDIVRAAMLHKVNIVALSFSNTMNANHALSAIGELRERLPSATGLWVGGTCPALERRLLEGVERLRLLTDIAPALARWRLRHAP